MKIVVTGGHLTPALAFIDYARSVRKDITFVFVGRRYMQEQELQTAREQDEIARRKIPFYVLNAAKIHRAVPYRNLFELGKIIQSLQQARAILKNEKPDLILSFGGYLAVPLALIAKLRGIPIVTHEQTATLGLANAFMSTFVHRVALAVPLKSMPRNAVVTGNPVRYSFLVHQDQRPAWLHRLSKKPLVFITGGSQGSHVLNETVRRALGNLTQFVMIVHQCGSSKSDHYMNDLEQAKQELSGQQRARYVVREWMTEQETAWLMQHSSLVVARAGANTVFEIELTGTPALFVPLPFAHGNEQQKNAERLVKIGSAKMIVQKHLTPESLTKEIKVLLSQLSKIKKRAVLHRLDVESRGSEKLLTECIRVHAETQID